MYLPEVVFCCCAQFPAVDVDQTTCFHFLWWFGSNNFHDFVIMFAAEHHFWSRHFMIILQVMLGCQPNRNSWLLQQVLKQLSRNLIWLGPEHHFWSRHFIAIFVQLCSGANQIEYYDIRRKLRTDWCSGFSICLAPEHHFLSRHFMAISISCALVLTK